MLGFLVKSIILVVIAILFRSALPRYRIDQVLNLNWKFFIYFLIFFYIFLMILLLLFL